MPGEDFFKPQREKSAEEIALLGRIKRSNRFSDDEIVTQMRKQLAREATARITGGVSVREAANLHATKRGEPRGTSGLAESVEGVLQKQVDEQVNAIMSGSYSKPELLRMFRKRGFNTKPGNDDRRGFFAKPGTGFGPFGILKPTDDPRLLSQAGDLVSDLAEVPGIQAMGRFFGKAASPVVGGLKAGLQAIGGDIDEAKATANRGFRAAKSALPFTDKGDDSDIVDFSELTREMGLKNQIIEFPIIGAFGTRDTIDFFGRFATDPFIASGLGVGRLVPKGQAARLAGTLTEASKAGRSFLGFGPRQAGIIGSNVAAQMASGDRALLSVVVPGVGRRAIRLLGSQKYIDAPVAEIFDMARRGMAFSKFGRLLNVKPGPQFEIARQEASAAAQLKIARQIDAADKLQIRIEKGAEVSGMSLNEFHREILNGARKPPRLIIEGDAVDLRPGQRAVRKTGEGTAARRSVEQELGKAQAEQARAGVADRAAREAAELRRTKATERASKIEDRAAKIRDEGNARARRRELEADEAGAGRSPAELQSEGRPAVPGGIKPDPAKARGLRAEAKAIRRKAIVKADALKKRATKIHTDAQKTFSDITGSGQPKKARGELPESGPGSEPLAPRGSARRKQLADAKADRLRIQQDLRTSGEIRATQAEADAILARQKALYREYIDAGFTPDEAVGGARAATLGGIDADAAVLAGQLENQFGAGLFGEMDAGIVISELTDPGQAYIARVLSDEGSALLAKSGMENKFRAFMRDWYARTSHARRRNALWDGMTVPEVNDWFKTHVPGFEKKLFFEEDPAFILARRAVKTQPAHRVSSMVEEYSKVFGRKTSEELIEAGHVPLTDILDETQLQAQRLPAGGSAKDLIEAEVSKALDNVIANPDGANMLGLNYDSIRHLPEAEQRLRLAPFEEKARRAAIRKLIAEKKIAPTVFGRGSTFGNRLKGTNPRDIVIPPEAARDMRHYLNVWMDKTTPGGIVKLYDGFQQMFKAGSTALWPAFHTRNNITNMWLLWASDGPNMASKLARADPVHNLGQKVGRVIKSVGLEDGSALIDTGHPKLGVIRADELLRQMEIRNAFGWGPTSKAELGAVARDPVSHGKVRWRSLFRPEPVERVGLPRSPGAGGVAEAGFAGGGFGFRNTKARKVVATFKAPFRAPNRLGRAVGSASEDFAKLTMYLNELEETGSHALAALKVKKYLLDYSDLSPFERKTLKRVFPFYKFARGTMPLLVETMIQKPGKFAEMAHVQRAFQNGGEPVNQTIVPFYAQKTMYGLEKGENGAVIIYSGSGLPIEDLSELIEDPWHNVLSRLDPMIKLGIQAATGKDLFRGKDLSEVAPSAFRHLPDPVKEFLSFRPVKDKSGRLLYYRASPMLLNWVRNGPFTNAAARFLNTVEKFDTPRLQGTQPDPLFKVLTGINRFELDFTSQKIHETLNLARFYMEFLDGKVAEGKVGKFGSQYSIRRDFVRNQRETGQPTEREWQLERARIKRAIKRLERARKSRRSLVRVQAGKEGQVVSEIGAAGGLRSGGR